MKLAYTALALGIAAATVIASPANAKVLALGQNTSIFSTSAASPTLVPIKGSETQMTFTLKKKGRVLITFSAECAVTGTDYSWADIDIILNGVTLSPTNSDDAFCSANETNVLDGEVMTSITVAPVAKAGKNVLKIQAKRTGANGDAIYLDDMTTVVVR